MASLILTRFLYSKDEVELSLLTSLLNKEDLQIVYYWLYELYYSGFDAFEFLWKIYLDFYYEQQPYFAAYFKKKQSLWKLDGSMVHIAYIVRNMHTLKPSCMVFMLRQYMDKEDILYPTIIYKVKEGGIIYGVLQMYDKKYHNLLLALEKRHYENICYYLRILCVNEISLVISRFLQCDIDNANVYINVHYLLAVIVRMLNKTVDHVDKKHLYVAPKQQHLDHILLLEQEQMPLTKHGLPQIYNTLMHKRYVCINDFIGSFELARFKWSTHEEFIKELYFHWEYYAMGSPLWLKRLQIFGGSINDKEKKIEFLGDGEEEFYNLYAYELDELPKEVQEMSMKRLNNTDGRAWYAHVFRGRVIDIHNPNHEEDHFWKWTY